MFMGDHIGAVFFVPSLSLLLGKAGRSGLQFAKHLGRHDGSSMDEPGRYLDRAVSFNGCEDVLR
jgi:hypothetical protein